MWCSLFVIIFMSRVTLQFPSNDEEAYHRWIMTQISAEGANALCQNILNQIISRMEHNDVYKLLQDGESYIDYWQFDVDIPGDRNFCTSHTSPSISFSWNPGHNNCITTEIFGVDGYWNITDHMCGIDTSSFTMSISDPSPDFKTINSNYARNKRSLTKKVVNSYINLAKEIEITECSNPIVKVHLNQALIYSNETTDITSEDVPTDIISVFVDVDIARFTNTLPSKTTKQLFVSDYELDFYGAQQDCRNRNMGLVSIKNAEEMEAIKEAIKYSSQTYFYTSGKKLSDLTTWYWSDGEKVGYTNWYIGEPNNQNLNENCFAVRQNDGEWFDTWCTGANYAFICESVNRIEETVIPPTIEIYVDDHLAYQKLSVDQENKEFANLITVIIGIKGDGIQVNDHTTKFSLHKKNSVQESPSEIKQVLPENFREEDFNGIDIRVENVKQNGLSCQRDKLYHYFVDQKLDYVDAEKFCQSQFTQLASIENEEEQLNIENVILKQNIDHYYWTSGRLADDAATWFWNEGKAITYTNWAKGEPNNLGGNERCIELFVPWKTVKWNDQECADKNRIICQNFTEPYWHLPTN